MGVWAGLRVLGSGPKHPGSLLPSLQVPNTQGASSPHSLILSGLWEAQAVQEIQVPPQELWIVEGAHVVPISPWFEASRG